MSKIKLRWLWIVVALEVLAIAGVLIWALALRQETPPPAATPKQAAPVVYNTPAIALQKVVEGFKQPVAIVAASRDANDKRLFIVEQGGTIRAATTAGNLAPEAFLDITAKVKNGGEQGLLGLAFHPKPSEQPYFYVNYTDKNGDTVIARYTIQNVADETWSADPGSEKILLAVNQPYDNHNGGDLAFGPDGYLYIGLGDGGSGGDPQDRAQDKDELLGKLLRIDVDNGDPYGIPASNPFANGGGRGEIWAWGLRNPWRFSFDRTNGDLFIADVGQGEWEEINYQPANKGGLNYGWRCYEGTHEFNTAGCQAAETYTKPIAEYDHSEDRCSVTGGYAYRGSQFPALLGKYFYGDYCGGQLYYTEQSAGAWTVVNAAETDTLISTFGEDAAGELYLADYQAGALYQITDTANP